MIRTILRNAAELCVSDLEKFGETTNAGHLCVRACVRPTTLASIYKTKQSRHYFPVSFVGDAHRAQRLDRDPRQNSSKGTNAHNVTEKTNKMQ